MHALLGAEHAVRVLARDGERGPVDADDLRLGGVVDRHPPPATLAVAQVHVEEHLAPVLRLEAPLARRDRHDGVTVIEVVREPAGELQLGQVVGQCVREVLRLREKLLVTGLLPQLEGGAGVIQLPASGLDAGNVLLVASKPLHDALRGSRVIPEPRDGALLLQDLCLRSLVFDVQVALHLGQALGQGVQGVCGYLGHQTRYLPWQFLNFLPLPQGHGSFLPTPT